MLSGNYSNRNTHHTVLWDSESFVKTKYNAEWTGFINSIGKRTRAARNTAKLFVPDLAGNWDYELTIHTESEATAMSASWIPIIEAGIKEWT